MAKSRRKDNERAPEQKAPQFAGDTSAETDRERVAQRAYELYLKRGASEGQDLDDWLSAEREVIGSPRNSSERPSDE
jgi:hypothetical protein